MSRKEANLISSLQANTRNIRNFCILAHVDHGKTTLADTLLATNGIISTRMSGKLRYMDSRQDEQERGITMKSSAISLVHTKDDANYVINLIDSPGHVDFSTEVSTAVRLCDGAIILIDVCEGICPQTHAVLRQASLENLKLILVLNKIDRLILELKMTPLEAYHHIADIIVQFNAIVAQQYTSLLCELNDRLSEESEADEAVEWIDDIDESKLYFSPKYNNVFFASSLDGWGFGIANFADIYAKKLGFKKETLLKTLWGDYYLNAKTKRIMKNAQENAKKPLFVQLIFESLWQVYDSVFVKRDPAMTEKILTSLSIKLPARDLKYTDPKGPLQALCVNWLPLGRNLLHMIVEVLPSPSEITAEKVQKLICNKMKSFKSLPRETQKLQEDFLSCSSEPSKPVIVFISKMFAAEKDSIAKKQLTLEDIALKREAIRLKKLEEQSRKENPEEPSYPCRANQTPASEPAAEEEEPESQKHVFLAFARVFSGTLRKGQSLFILSPKHNCEDFVGHDVTPETPLAELQAVSKHVTKFTVNDIYLMMGRELELIDEVPCGNIVAIGGLENLILKSATLSTTVYCPSFTSMYMQTSPIVRVAIEPKNPAKMGELLKGLKLLNQSDPCVEIMVQDNGEHILCTAGEVHLQRCIEDLVQRFAMIEVNVSPPIIPFKETIIEPPKFDYLKEKIKPEQAPQPQKDYQKEKDQQGGAVGQGQEQQSPVAGGGQSSAGPQASFKDQLVVAGPEGRIEMSSQDKRLVLSVRAKPLPIQITRFLENNVGQIKILARLNQNLLADAEKASFAPALRDFQESLRKEFETLDAEETGGFPWLSHLGRIISFGPSRCGANILVNMLDAEDRVNSVWSQLDGRSGAASVLKDFENNFVSGFQLATSKGPLCEEPMQGVAFFVEKFQVNESPLEEQFKQQLDLDASATAELDSSSASTANETDEQTSPRQLANGSFTGAAETKKIKTTQSLSSQCISLSKEAFRRAFEAQPTRLMVAMFKCEIMTVNSEALGKLYAVLGKRNGKILDETMKDGTSMFIITAQIPVADSFGLAEEIRKRTSGLASPHIEFSHFETIEMDPFWEPKTEEELLLFGDKADFENQAKKYMNDVRKRKGLFVKEKLVEHSEKQRTLAVK